MALSETFKAPETIPYGEKRISLSSKGREIFVISDLHIASGLNSNGNYDGTENFFADGSFVRFLDYLETTIPDGKKGLLIINGDLVDFLRIRDIPATTKDFERWKDILSDLGIAMPIINLQNSITKKEVKYGLRTDDYKSVWKLFISAKGHSLLFKRLALWTGNGNEILVTKGNHDLEWYWKPVRNYFRLLLARFLAGQRLSGKMDLLANERLTADYFLTMNDSTGEIERALKEMVIPRVHFADDSLVIDGKVYIEHGHRYENFTAVDGPPVLPNDTQLNLPFGSFFNRYLINRIELAYPHIDDVRPRQNILPLLLRERFPLAIQLLFSYIPFTFLIIPKRQYGYALRYLFHFLLIIIVPVVVTGFALFKSFPNILHTGASTGSASPSVWQQIFSELKNLLFLSLSYFLGRLFAMLQLSSPSTLFPAAQRLFKENPEFQLVTFGHTHNPEQLNGETTGGKAAKKGDGWDGGEGIGRYCNTGTWIPVYEMDAADVRLDKTYTFLHLEIDEAGNIKEPDLFRWNDDARRIDPLVLVDLK